MALSEAILIAGPTASGKSALAVERALAVDGEVVNADSMQVYDGLKIVTARPDAEEMAGVPHHLFGHVDPARSYSVAAWLDDLHPVLSDLKARGKVPVIVGGTGLYFKALLEGLHSVPQIDPAIREDVRRELLTEGPEALHGKLAECDPSSAARLKKTDGHRVARALEVVLSTGETMEVHHGCQADPVLSSHRPIEKLLLLPPRNTLYQRINARCEAMISAGALDEIRDMVNQDLRDDTTALKAIGVPQLRDIIEKKQSLEEGLEGWKTATRRYAKRQMTWFRNQLGDDWEHLT